MKSLTSKLLLSIGIVTIFSSFFLLYQSYKVTNRRINDVVEQQAAMALKFDLAIRGYIAKHVRPLMYELLGEEEFIPETMSTSYVARSIFDDVRNEFPDYIIKFSSDNPRNPANQAGPEELEIIERFNNNPHLKRWEGIIAIGQKEYMAKFSARRMKHSCLKCHGDPKDAPASMVKRYGATAGFHRPIGKVIGMDTVAIPMTKISEKLWVEFVNTFFAIGLGLLVFLGVIFLIARFLIIARLTMISEHFAGAAQESDYSKIEPIKMRGKDEIANLAFSFNVLIKKMKGIYSSLDVQVEERTKELENANEKLLLEIDERKKAEEELVTTKGLLEAAIAHSPSGILIADAPDVSIRLANPAAISIRGGDAKLLTGIEVKRHAVNWQAYRPDGSPYPSDQLPLSRAVLWGKVTQDEEVIIRHQDGKDHWVSANAAPILDERGRVTAGIVVFHDITERKQMEVKLQQAKKMEAIGTLAGGVAHDLNNILSGIVGYPDLLLMDMPQDSPLRKPILTMKRSGEKAATIVQDLLTLARRGVAVEEVVNLNEVIEEYVKSPEYKKLDSFHSNITLEISLDAKLLNILGSSVHLTKTVMNLVSNAAEAMPGGGKVIIATENRYIDMPIGKYEKVEEGDYVVLTVNDSGMGILQEDLDKIFEPFYTKKVMGRSGTGLGMTVVWGTVKDHNGYIDIQSIEGKGTTFTIYFPVSRKELEIGKVSSTIEYYMGNKESVLVVDDMEEQREIASAMLKKLDYSVLSVASGEEAIEYLKENKVDLLLLDMIMEPGMDGLDTYREVLKIHPKQKAIIASGYSETGRVKELHKLGVKKYLKKPYVIENIGLAVKDGLEK